MKRAIGRIASLALVITCTIAPRSALAQADDAPAPPAPAPSAGSAEASPAAPAPPPPSRPPPTREPDAERAPPIEIGGAADKAEARPTGEPRPERFRISIGPKIGYVATDGFDAFARTNTLAQFSVDGTYTLATSGRLALAAGVGYDVGGRGDPMRGLSASLISHRFLVPIEGRFAVLPWLWAFGKVSPGAGLVVIDVEDPSSPRSLSDGAWAFTADVSAGASFVIGRRAPDKRNVRILLTPELGYAMSTAASLRANPGREDEDLLGADEDTRLRSVAMSGFFWRASVGVTF